MAPLTLERPASGRCEQTGSFHHGHTSPWGRNGFRGAQIDIQMVLHLLTFLQLVVEQSLKHGVIRCLGIHPCKDTLPATHEGSEVIVHEPHVEEILHGIGGSVLDARAQVLVHHEKHLSPTNWIPLLRLYLLEGVDLSRQVTLNDVGEGGQQLGVQAR